MAKVNGRDRGRPSKEPVRPVEEQPREYECGHDAFMRIAEGRVNGLLTKLNTLGRLASGKSHYGYTDEDVEHIRVTLTQAVNATCNHLRRKPVKEGFSFTRMAKDASA